SPLDITEFRGRMFPGGSAPSTATNYKKPEDELAAKFGTSLAGAAAIIAASTTKEIAPAVGAEAIKRRENIEQVLGPLSPQHKDSRIRYVARLGDTWRSIATK